MRRYSPDAYKIKAEVHRADFGESPKVLGADEEVVGEVVVMHQKCFRENLYRWNVAEQRGDTDGAGEDGLRVGDSPLPQFLKNRGGRMIDEKGGEALLTDVQAAQLWNRRCCAS